MSSLSERLPGLNLFRLEGRTAIVTGGSKGLGFAMAAGLASAGAKVMLVSRQGSEAVSAAEQISDEYGLDAFGYGADVTDAEQVEHMVQSALIRWRRIDILINSAGINIRGPIESLSEADFDEVYRINVKGGWLAAHGVVPVMKKAGYGCIINVAKRPGARRAGQSNTLHQQ
ncbi:MAG: SDR family NAD(P)-dependent oxidoreductase [Pirellulales bacterium]